MNRQTLFASDLDGTMIPLENDPSYLDSINTLGTALKQESLVLTYITGRRLSLALEGIQQFSLPQPEIIVSDVGSTISHRKDSEWLSDGSYRARLIEAWGGRNAETIADSLGAIDGLQLQEAECQAEFKCSYYVNLARNTTTVIEETKTKLDAQSIDAQFVFSIDPKKNVGLLDLLPPGVSKKSALDHLCDSLGFEESKVIYAGDSGNDLEIFLSGYRAILVANTPAEIIEDTQCKALESGSPERIFVAKSRYSTGVLEGCRHFGVLCPG